MYSKKSFKIFVGSLLSIALFVASGSISLAFAAQDTVHRDAKSSHVENKTRMVGNGKLDSLHQADTENSWTCPMHPEIHKHAPGKCPVCKMNLVKAKPNNT